MPATPKKAEEKADAKQEEKKTNKEATNDGLKGDKSDATPAKSSSGVDKEELKKDPKFAKYFKMLSVGVAKGNVYAKMASEGFSPEDLEKFR